MALLLGLGISWLTTIVWIYLATYIVVVTVLVGSMDIVLKRKSKDSASLGISSHSHQGIWLSAGTKIQVYTHYSEASSQFYSLGTRGTSGWELFWAVILQIPKSVSCSGTSAKLFSTLSARLTPPETHAHCETAEKQYVPRAPSKPQKKSQLQSGLF